MPSTSSPTPIDSVSVSAESDPETLAPTLPRENLVQTTPPKSSRLFRAPWSPGVQIWTHLILFCCVVALVLVWSLPDPLHPDRPYWVTLAVLMGVAGSWAVGVRSYEVTPQGLRIRRGLGSTWYAWESLDFLELNPRAARGSWRLFGLSGLFSYTGWFWNRDLGVFRLHGTDLTRTVLMRFGLRTILVTPDPPIEFVNAVEKIAWTSQK